MRRRQSNVAVKKFYLSPSVVQRIIFVVDIISKWLLVTVWTEGFCVDRNGGTLKGQDVAYAVKCNRQKTLKLPKCGPEDYICG